MKLESGHYDEESQKAAVVAAAGLLAIGAAACSGEDVQNFDGPDNQIMSGPSGGPTGAGGAGGSSAESTGAGAETGAGGGEACLIAKQTKMGTCIVECTPEGAVMTAIGTVNGGDCSFSYKGLDDVNMKFPGQGEKSAFLKLVDADKPLYRAVFTSVDPELTIKARNTSTLDSVEGIEVPLSNGTHVFVDASVASAEVEVSQTDTEILGKTVEQTSAWNLQGQKSVPIDLMLGSNNVLLKDQEVTLSKADLLAKEDEVGGPGESGSTGAGANGAETVGASTGGGNGSSENCTFSHSGVQDSTGTAALALLAAAGFAAARRKMKA